jgi:alginate O-acetyltransferase complex protein AlgI
MPFSRVEFLLFLGVVLAGSALLRPGRDRKALLLAAGASFYAWWDWRFLGLVAASALVDWALGLGIGAAGAPGRRKGLLVLGVAWHLVLLGLFKYGDFFLETLRPLVLGLGLHAKSLDLILPLGLSFQTFQALTYLVGVERGTFAARKSLLDVAVFSGFFPCLVAGPILRAEQFLPQLDQARGPTVEGLYVGFRRFCFGLFKKVFLADRLALFVDPVFANAGAFDCATTWLAALAYTLQIYLDFSGYSDMAVGAARALGYEIPENFLFPYAARSVADFWRRWHISLSGWIRDYLYIPLGGSRKGTARTLFNLVLSMLLCGLWHGAGWTFVSWGGLHGAALAGGRAWRDVVRRGCTPGPSAGPGAVLAWAATLLFVVVGWVLFRAEGFGQAWLMLRQMFAPAPGVAWLHPFVFFALGLTAAAHVLHLLGRDEALLLERRGRYDPAVLFCLLWLVVLFAPERFSPFIYAGF